MCRKRPRVSPAGGATSSIVSVTTPPEKMPVAHRRGHHVVEDRARQGRDGVDHRLGRVDQVGREGPGRPQDRRQLTGLLRRDRQDRVEEPVPRPSGLPHHRRGRRHEGGREDDGVGELLRHGTSLPRRRRACQRRTPGRARRGVDRRRALAGNARSADAVSPHSGYEVAHPLERAEGVGTDLEREQRDARVPVNELMGRCGQAREHRLLQGGDGALLRGAPPAEGAPSGRRSSTRTRARPCAVAVRTSGSITGVASGAARPTRAQPGQDGDPAQDRPTAAELPGGVRRYARLRGACGSPPRRCHARTSPSA